MDVFGDVGVVTAAMEPGREDREHTQMTKYVGAQIDSLQWNPAVKTGSTQSWGAGRIGCWISAAMEPGREDREHEVR